MKSLRIIGVLMLLAISSFAQTPYESLNYLYSIRGNTTIGGIHNRQPISNPNQYSQQLNSITGDWPGLYSSDFMFESWEIDDRQTMINQVINEWNNGAMINLMWHACNPVSGEACNWDGNGVLANLSNSQWNDLLTNGTTINNNWKAMMDEVATYLQQLEDAGVEVFFRPLHEMNQGMFWWGGRPGSGGTGGNGGQDLDNSNGTPGGGGFYTDGGCWDCWSGPQGVGKAYLNGGAGGSGGWFDGGYGGGATGWSNGSGGAAGGGYSGGGSQEHGNGNGGGLLGGLGGGSTQKAYNHYYPDIQVDTVELDPMVASVAKRFFGVKESPKLKIHVSDGRVYLKKNKGVKYDIILLDAYTSHRNGSYIPYHLATKEFFELVSKNLVDNGVLGYNVIGTYDGWRADNVGSLHQTLQSVYPNVYHFPATETRNIVFVATKEKAALTTESLGTKYAELLKAHPKLSPQFLKRVQVIRNQEPKSAKRSPVLTDSYTPASGLLGSRWR
mgnify:CR=1 FL=1